ncbi:MAG: metallophosphoesterase [Thermacetogeniaceae bacterium]|nr:metallophosphoesterase [Thermoanaerobacterales bacterium]NLN22097.1 metallophosphoesterase [Syntrophomonadaceae bacterium]
MRIGILSDSHGKLEKAEKALQEMGNIELLLHAGDYRKDALMLGSAHGIEVKSVIGNCDRFALGPAEELMEINSYKIYLTHGHLFGVKYSLDRLKKQAERLGADIVIYGHTHVSHQEKMNGILFLNPGSITWPLIPGRHSYAVLEVDPSGYSCEICEL